MFIDIIFGEHWLLKIGLFFHFVAWMVGNEEIGVEGDLTVEWDEINLFCKRNYFRPPLLEKGNMGINFDENFDNIF